MIFEALLLLAAMPQATAARAEALWQQQRFEEANAAFRLALQQEPRSASLRVRWARLLLDRFNPGDAEQLCREALEIDSRSAPAYLALALIHAQAFDPRAAEEAQHALDIDPKLEEARELLADIYLQDGDFARAAQNARLLPESLPAIATLATIELLQDQPATQHLARLSGSGESHARIARQLVLNRRYQEAIVHYRKAVELAPQFLPAQSELGINLMRVGEDAEARRILEKAYAAGYRNAATANSLKLLDSYRNFVTYRHPRFILRLHRSEAELLRIYVEREVQRALETYDKKYGFSLAAPVTIEMYPDHEDFAVRTLGMPGLGALGVTFGYSVVMDSPSARKPGTFHWASTLWHELSHVYVLAATRHRVPRWFTEGVAVFEETATLPEWREPVDESVLKAVSDKRLLPVATLDRGFMRPSYPGQVIVSYFQAGQICTFIHQRYGWPKLLSMIQDFSRATTTAAVIEHEFGVASTEFDRQFQLWLAQQHFEPGKPLHDPAAEKKAAAELEASGDLSAAERRLSALLWVYPARDEELHRSLAGIRARLGRHAEAAEEWRAVLASKPVDPSSAHYGLALALKGLQRFDEARDEVVAALEAAPGYRPAQRLLLELNSREAPGQGPEQHD